MGGGGEGCRGGLLLAAAARRDVKVARLLTARNKLIITGFRLGTESVRGPCSPLKALIGDDEEWYAAYTCQTVFLFLFCCWVVGGFIFVAGGA